MSVPQGERGRDEVTVDRCGDANKEIAELNRFYEEEIKNGLHEKDERRKGD
jgi:hypothetical protein